MSALPIVEPIGEAYGVEPSDVDYGKVFVSRNDTVLVAIVGSGIDVYFSEGGVAHVCVVQTERVCACRVFGVEKLDVLAGSHVVGANVIGITHSAIPARAELPDERIGGISRIAHRGPCDSDSPRVSDERGEEKNGE